MLVIVKDHSNEFLCNSNIRHITIAGCKKNFVSRLLQTTVGRITGNKLFISNIGAVEAPEMFSAHQSWYKSS